MVSWESSLAECPFLPGHINHTGNLVKDTTSDGSIIYTYDDVYNLTAITDRQGAAHSFTYDANGNQLTALDVASGKTVSFAYSPRGFLTQATDAHGAVESFAYDAAGNLTQRQDTVGLQNFTTTFDHTPRNQLKTVTRGSETSNFTYDATGNLATKSYPNGVNTSYTHDANGRLTSQQATNGGQTIQSFSQTYDQAGNIVSLTEQTNPPLGSSFTNSYAYDALNRVTQENIAGHGSIAYTYDRAGNRLTMSNLTAQTTYSYNQANQLISLTSGINTTGFTYTAGGALSQKTTGSNTTNFVYDGLDRLTGVVASNNSVNYAYDALGRRITRTENGSTTNFHPSGKSDLTDYETTGIDLILSAAYLRGADGLISQTAYDDPQPTSTYYHYNPHGDTSALTGSDGKLSRSYRYDAFGNPVGKTAYVTDPLTGQTIPSAVTPEELTYGYTGKWQRDKDLATGTVRMGVREYDPNLGRFIAMDPLKGKAQNPQTRNRYEYALNSPARYYDLNGLYPGETIVDAAEGTFSDAIKGGVSAFEEEGTVDSFFAGAAGSYWDNWKSGFDSMSRGEQIALLAIPAGAIAITVGVEAAGVGGTRIASELITTTTVGLWARISAGSAGLLSRTGIKCVDKGSKARSVTTFADKSAARQALSGNQQAAANRFFRAATSKSINYKVTDLGGGVQRLEFFSPARNPGYGKLYVQEIDANGTILRSYKNTIGPNGLIETKWLRGGPIQ